MNKITEFHKTLPGLYFKNNDKMFHTAGHDIDIENKVLSDWKLVFLDDCRFIKSGHSKILRILFRIHFEKDLIWWNHDR